ncbi:histidine kinase [Nonomuraea angiospora]|uniref:sensor histidine kinase n=1 Tax=Nonomuraea angiospora TaxID=46172 RepID=UPI0033C1DB31
MRRPPVEERVERRTRNGVLATAALTTAGHLAVAGWAGDERASGLWDLTRVPWPIWASWIYVVLGLMIWSQHGGRVFPFTLASLAVGLLGWLGGELLVGTPFDPVPGLVLLLPVCVTWPAETLILTARARLRRVRTLAAENARLHREVEDARVRAIEAMDAGRRSVERDLHDGAQQRLVNLSLSLSLAQTRFTGPPEASAALDRAMTELDAALEELRELAHGIHPAILSASGLGPALRSLAERAALPVVLTDLPARRLPPRVEETAYFVVSEAIANACKHARASEAVVALDDTGDELRLTVSDDGVGGADPGGHGLRGLADRVTVLGGRFAVESPPGQGTRIAAVLPVASPGRLRDQG